MKSFLGWPLWGIAICLLLLSNCVRNEELPNPTSAHTVSQTMTSQKLRQILDLFGQRDYAKKLVVQLTDKEQTRVHWIPQWLKAIQVQRPGDSAYVYVPLEARLTKSPYTIDMVGTKRYLLVKSVGGQLEFSVATYMFKEVKPLPGNAGAARDQGFFASFTGVLTLKNLDTEEGARFVYQNGQAVLSRPAKASEDPNDIVCVNFVTCTWSASCIDRWGNLDVVGTMTSGIDYCSEPGYEPCSDWQRSWTQTGSQTDQQCHYEDPPPPPDGGGDGGGGGGDDDDDDDDEDPKSPCQQMNELSQEWAFNAAIAGLQSDVNNNALEVGYTFLKGNDPSSFVRTVGAVDKIEMAAAGRPVGGAMHTHPAGNDALPIFSPRDLQSIYKSMDALDIDPATYTYTVVVYNGVSYSLKIDDPVAFKSFGDNWLSNDFNRWALSDYYYDDKSGGIGAPNKTVVDNEKAFLAMLAHNSGLSLFKYDQANNSWPQLNLDSNNNLTTVPCL